MLVPNTAVLPAPVPTMPLAHLVVSLQLPPPVALQEPGPPASPIVKSRKLPVVLKT